MPDCRCCPIRAFVLRANGRSNNVTIDGADNNDYSGGSVRNTLSQEAIQEFQINRSNFSAEFGHASGGLINIVTKSGTNTLHGNLFFYWRDHRLDARNAFAFGPDFSDIDPQFSRIQYGLTLGGPLVRDRDILFRFVRTPGPHGIAISALQPESCGLSTDNGQASLVAADRHPASQRGYSGARALAQAMSSVFTLGPTSLAHKLLDQESGVKPFFSEFTTGMFRVDHAFSQKNQINARFSVADTYDEGFVIANLRARTNGANNSTRDTGIVLSDTNVFNPRIVNEGRFQFSSAAFQFHSGRPQRPEPLHFRDRRFRPQLQHRLAARTEDRYQFVEQPLVQLRTS